MTAHNQGPRTVRQAYWRVLGLPKQIVSRFQNFLMPSGPGDWIFTTKVMSWAFSPPLRRQLPWTHRVFAGYASLFKNQESGRILLGDKIFPLVIALHRLLRLPTKVLVHLGDYTVFLNPSDPRMWQVPNELTDPALDALKLQHFVAEGDSFIDVGANHGSFSLVASRIVGPSGKVISVEPQPALARLVELSLARTAKAPFLIYRFACSDHDGSAEFFVPTGSSGSAGLISAFSAKERHKTFSVPLKRFDTTPDWKSLPGRTFVKLDIEGSELAFLKGAQRMLEERRPMLMMELNPTSMSGAGVELHELVDFLTGCGYAHYIELDKPDQLDKRYLLKNICSSPRNVVIC